MTPAEAYNRWWLPIGASAQAGEVDRLIVTVHIFMALLFFGWGIFFVYCLVRFRARGPASGEAGDATATPPRAPPAPGVPKAIEALVVLVEVALLAGVSIPLWSRLRDPAAVPDAAASTRVRVVAQQFQWNVHYPGKDQRFGRTEVRFVNDQENPLGIDREDPDGKDDILLVGALRAPIGRPLVVALSSKDVIHSFKVPVARLTQDVVPGVPASAWFTPTLEGTFDIECAQLCGLGHTRMRGALVIQSETEFEGWLDEQERKLRK